MFRQFVLPCKQLDLFGRKLLAVDGRRGHGHAYPGLYAAIGVHSGLACGAATDMPSAFNAMRQGAAGSMAGLEQRRTVPTIVFHGDRDTTVDLRNGDAVASQAADGARLRARVEKGLVPGGHSFTRAVHADAAGRPVVEQWVLHGVRHAWAGGSPEGSYTDPRGPVPAGKWFASFVKLPHRRRTAGTERGGRYTKFKRNVNTRQTVRELGRLGRPRARLGRKPTAGH